MKIITFGVFDLLHEGHKNLFLRSKALGDHLIVAVQTDNFVAVNKPGTVLSDNLEKRKTKILHTKIVDEVISYEQIDETIKEVDFDILAVGGDQVNPHFMKAIEWCKENGKKVVRIPRTDGISSTWLRLHLNKIVHMTPKNENEINLKLLFKMPWSIYPFSNYKKYGLKNRIFKVYVLNGVVFTTYGKALQFCSETEEKTFYKLVSKFIKRHKIKMVSGPTSSLKLIQEFISPKLFETGLICEMKKDEAGTLEISKATNDDEFRKVAELLNEVNTETNEHYYKVDELYNMLQTRFQDNYGRTLYYKNNDEFIATVSTYAENDEYAVIGGLAVKKEYRLQGIGSNIFKTLVNDLKTENKKVFLFVYNKNIMPFYQKTTEQEFEFSKMYF